MHNDVIMTFGCQQIPLGAICEDDDLCTTGTTCALRLMRAGTLVECDDGNACTFEACDPVQGCQFTNAIIFCG